MWEGSKDKLFLQNFADVIRARCPTKGRSKQAEAEFLLSLPRFMDHNAASVFITSAEVKTEERNPLQPSEERKTNDIPATEDN